VRGRRPGSGACSAAWRVAALSWPAAGSGVEPRLAHGPSNQRFGISEHDHQGPHPKPDRVGRGSAILAVGSAGHSLRRPVETRYSPLPAVRRIELADLRDVLARGLSELRGVPDRRQAMSRSLDQPILVSASFAACGEQRERLVSIGRYALRGVGRPQELFTLDLAERAPPRRPEVARGASGRRRRCRPLCVAALRDLNRIAALAADDGARGPAERVDPGLDGDPIGVLDRGIVIDAQTPAVVEDGRSPTCR
jgi:hypothetical protein